MSPSSKDKPVEVLAIIPARGGSKSIPKKNIYPILGKPLIAYSIETARNSKLITRIVVSTDDEEIASIAKEYGAEIPFLRPKELAQDHTSDFPVFEHALRALKETGGYEPDIVVHLWPTSPYRKENDVDDGITLLANDANADSVRSVTKPSQVPFKMWRKDRGVYLTPIMRSEYDDLYKTNIPPHESPRQSLPETLVQTGYFAVIRPRTILHKCSMMGEYIIPFFHDPETYTELDSLKDLYHTEHVLKEYYK